MVQKDNFQSEKSLQKLILALLIIFTIPLPARPGSQIPNRKNCSLLKKKQNYNYYDRRKHMILTKNSSSDSQKDIRGIYKNVLIDELENGQEENS